MKIAEFYQVARYVFSHSPTGALDMVAKAQEKEQPFNLETAHIAGKLESDYMLKK